MEATRPIEVMITTTSTMEDAKKLSHQLVKLQLVACVQLSTIESIYSWNNEIQQDEEVRLMIKLVPEKKTEVVAFINKNHPYDTPEIISTSFDSEIAYAKSGAMRYRE